MGPTRWGPRVVNPPPPRASGPRTPQLSPSCRASLSSAVVGARWSASSSPSLRAPASWAVLGLWAASAWSALSGGALHRFLQHPSVHSQADHSMSLSSLPIAPKNTEAAAKEGLCALPVCGRKRAAEGIGVFPRCALRLPRLLEFAGRGGLTLL